MAIVSKKRNYNRNQNRNKRMRSRTNRNKSKYLFSRQSGGSKHEFYKKRALHEFHNERTKINVLLGHRNEVGIDKLFKYIHNTLNYEQYNNKYLILLYIQNLKFILKFFDKIQQIVTPENSPASDPIHLDKVLEQLKETSTAWRSPELPQENSGPSKAFEHSIIFFITYLLIDTDWKEKLIKNKDLNFYIDATTNVNDIKVSFNVDDKTFVFQRDFLTQPGDSENQIRDNIISNNITRFRMSFFLKIKQCLEKLLKCVNPNPTATVTTATVTATVDRKACTTNDKTEYNITATLQDSSKYSITPSLKTATTGKTVCKKNAGAAAGGVDPGALAGAPPAPAGINTGTGTEQAPEIGITSLIEEIEENASENIVELKCTLEINNPSDIDITQENILFTQSDGQVLEPKNFKFANNILQEALASFKEFFDLYENAKDQAQEKLKLYNCEQFDFVIDGKTSKFIRYIPGERKITRRLSSTSSISSTASIDYKKTKHFISKVVKNTNTNTNICNLYIICVNCLGDIYIFLFELNKVKRLSGTSRSAGERCERRKSTDIFDDKTHDKIKKIFRLDNTKLDLFKNISIDLDAAVSQASPDKLVDNINPEQDIRSFCDKVDFSQRTVDNPHLSLCTSSEIVLKQENDKIIQTSNITHCMLNYFTHVDPQNNNTLFFRKTPNIYHVVTTTDIKDMNSFMKKMLLNNFSGYEFLIWEEKYTPAASALAESASDVPASALAASEVPASAASAEPGRIDPQFHLKTECNKVLPDDMKEKCNTLSEDRDFTEDESYIDSNVLLDGDFHQLSGNKKKYKISDFGVDDIIAYEIPPDQFQGFSEPKTEFIFCENNSTVNQDPIAIYEKQEGADSVCKYKNYESENAIKILGSSTEASGGARTKRNNRRVNKNKFNTKRRQKKMKRFNQSRKRNKKNTRNKLLRKSNKNKQNL